MNAETAYLFRHVLLHQAARELFLPSHAAALHALAHDVIVDSFGLAPRALDYSGCWESARKVCEGDGLALELAQHCRQASSGSDPKSAAVWLKRELAWLPIGALHAANALDRAACLQACARIVDHPDCPALTAIGASILACGQLHETSRFEEAKKYGLRACETARKAGEGRRLGHALTALGVVYSYADELDTARQLFREAMDLLDAHQDTRSAAMARTNLASLMDETGQFAEMLAMAQLARSQHETSGNDIGRVVSMAVCAAALEGLKREAECEAMLLAIADLAEGMGSAFYKGKNLTNLAMCYARQGRLELAEKTYREALAVHEHVGNRLSEVIALDHLAILLDDLGRHDEAQALLVRGLAIAIELGNVRQQAYLKSSLAVNSLKRGQLKEATPYMDAVRQWAESRPHELDKLNTELNVAMADYFALFDPDPRR